MIYFDEGRKGCTNAMYMYGNTLSAFPTEPLDGCIRNLVEMKYSCMVPHPCLDFCRQTPPRGGSRAWQTYVNEGSLLLRTSNWKNTATN